MIFFEWRVCWYDRVYKYGIERQGSVREVIVCEDVFRTFVSWANES